MKILHCCLANFYIDRYGYQENILPKMHKLQGHNVQIIASTETFVDDMNLGYLAPSSYYTEDAIPITRIPYVRWLPHFIVKKLRIYHGVFEIIKNFKPDIIFLHDVQFMSIVEFVRYAKIDDNVKIFADGHTDFNVSARNWLSKNILHKIIYKYCAKKIEPYLKKFYGVLPIRVDFIKQVYGINPEKVELLPLGGDLTNVEFEKKSEIRSKLRIENKINENDFLIITGGKIEYNKNITILMQAINELANTNIKLLIFGKVNLYLKKEFDLLLNSTYIRYVGWKSYDEIMKYFLTADLAVFPGRHSVLWEQSVAVGLPGIFKKWDGIQHYDVGGNCIFLDEISIISLREVISKVYSDKNIFEDMKKNAVEKGIKAFSYYEIAKKAIDS